MGARWDLSVRSQSFRVTSMNVFTLSRSLGMLMHFYIASEVFNFVDVKYVNRFSFSCFSSFYFSYFRWQLPKIITFKST